jgi:plasmid stabilization system protein ParE
VSLPIVFRPVARFEFDEAANWYEQRRPGRGAAFTAAVRQVLNRISEQPGFYAEVFEDVREALMSGYPYCVYYRAEPKQVLVFAVFHTARDPSIWQGRA